MIMVIYYIDLGGTCTCISDSNTCSNNYTDF